MINLKINLGNMPEYIFNGNVLIPGVIFLLVIWLIYRIKRRIKLTVVDEIYKEINKNFPAIKRIIDDLEHKISYLNNRAQDVERKINEFENKIKKYTNANNDIK